MAYGKAIELFLVDGTANGLVTAELSNWNGKAIKIPRVEVSECKRDDLSQAGIYFLFCKEDSGDDSVYIGEAEDVKSRLKQHLTDYENGKETYYWNAAVVFVGRDLNKALIRYLENRIVNIARACKRYIVLTIKTVRNPVLKESQIAAMEEFVDHVRVLINTLGYKVLEPLVQKVNDEKSIVNQDFIIKTSSVSAIGRVTTEGFVLVKGAVVNKKTSSRSLGSGLVNLRHKILNSDKMDGLKTIEDILFTSSSAAADFVLGYSVSGQATWKTPGGKTLKELESALT